MNNIFWVICWKYTRGLMSLKPLNIDTKILIILLIGIAIENIKSGNTKDEFWKIFSEMQVEENNNITAIAELAIIVTNSEENMMSGILLYSFLPLQYAKFLVTPRVIPSVPIVENSCKKE